jgi:hypothetical protein
MAQARKNPLAPGLYSIDLFQPTSSRPTQKDQCPIFRNWRVAQGDRVKVRRVQEFPEPLLGGPLRTFVVFEVLSPPGAFPFGQLGFPDTPPIDSGDAPAPEGPGLLDMFGSLGQAESAIAIVALLWLLSKSK